MLYSQLSRAQFYQKFIIEHFNSILECFVDIELYLTPLQ